MNKLLFNPVTQSIVMYCGSTYYDMRTGNPISNPGKLPKLKPYSEYTKSKFEVLNPSQESIEIDGHRFDIIQNPDNLEEYQLGGNFPRYFWKGCLKLIKDNTFGL